jgi:hypothetical protein
MTSPDRAYVSQFSSEVLGISVTVATVPTNADGAVTVTVVNADTQATLFQRQATNVGTGQYQLSLTPDDTALLGNYAATWSYQTSGIQRTFTGYYAIGGAQPAYDGLQPAFQQIVDNVWIRFADLFDSPSGGPNMQTYFQTNWSRGRIAQLLGFGIGYLNTMAQPYASYSITNFPTAQWGPLLEQATLVEALKHLRRSYVEQPEFQGSQVARLDRRDYLQRWEDVLADEQVLLKSQLDVWKISQMGLGRPAILVSGGIFGRYAPSTLPGTAGRPRAWFANLW